MCTLVVTRRGFAPFETPGDLRSPIFFSKSSSLPVARTDTTENFSGAISQDGTTIYLVDHDDGTAYCELITADELEIIYLSDDSDSAHVFIIDLVRQ